MQRELLDRRTWATRAELASAIFEWIEGSNTPESLAFLTPRARAVLGPDVDS